MADDAGGIPELDQMKYDTDEQVKIICLGDSAVGKSKWVETRLLTTVLCFIQLLVCNVLQPVQHYIVVFFLFLSQADGEVSHGSIVSFNTFRNVKWNSTSGTFILKAHPSILYYTTAIVITASVCSWACCLRWSWHPSLTLFCSRPQQLSTYALTLYKHTETVGNKAIVVGMYFKCVVLQLQEIISLS